MRATIGVLVLGALAGLLVPLSPLGHAPAAHAAKATAGASTFAPTIEWISWGTHDGNVANNTSRVTTATIAGEAVSITCRLSNLTGGEIRGYSPGTWTGDAFDEMFNSGSTGVGNTLDVALKPSTDGGRRSFDIACSATMNDQSVTLGGLVFADAEQSGNLEFVGATAPSNATWRLIDRYRANDCTQSSYGYRPASNPTRLELHGPTAATCSAGPAAVAFADGAWSLSDVTVSGGGLSAIAIGVMLPYDFGDAPQSYGVAGANVQPQLQGGVIPTTRNDWSTTNRGVDLFSSSVPLAAVGATSTVGMIGATVDAESTPLFSASAGGDDSASPGSDDEDARFGGSSSTLAPSVTAGQPYSTTVGCTGTGAVRAWLDWDRDGTFSQAQDASSLAACQNGSATLAWTVPAAASTGATFLRIRIVPAAVTPLPVGIAVGGEVEDHRVTVTAQVPRLLLTKTATVDPDQLGRPGDRVTYTLELRNTGSSVYDVNISDDLTDVLSGAAFVPGSLVALGQSVQPAFANGRITWSSAGSYTRPVLAANETVTIQYALDLTAAARGRRLVNAATAAATSGLWIFGQRYESTTSHTIEVGVALQAQHNWIVDGAAFSASQASAAGFTAAATATAPAASTSSALAWGAAREGYRSGASVTLATSVALPPGAACTVQSTQATVNDAVRSLSTPVVLSAPKTDVVITTRVQCDTRLTLLNVVDGSAAPGSWRLTATPSTGPAMSGPTGTSAAVRAGIDYRLGQGGGHAKYTPGSWTCNTAGDGTAVAVTNGAVRVPLGTHVECSVTQAAAQITMLMAIEPAAAGTLQPGMFTLSATPSAFDGLSTERVRGNSSPSSANCIEVRPGHTYSLAQTSGYATADASLEQWDGASWIAVADPDAVTMPAAGETAVYRFVATVPTPLTLPLTGGIGSDAFVFGGSALLLLAAALLLIRNRLRRPEAPLT